MVVTSSAAAVIHPVTEHVVLDETSYNEAAIQEVQAKGDASPPMSVYCASKTLAEKAVWEFVEKNPGLGWEAVTVLPAFVYGVRLSGPQERKGLS